MFLKTEIKIPEVKTTMSEMMTHHRINSSELENSDKHYLRGDSVGEGEIKMIRIPGSWGLMSSGLPYMFSKAEGETEVVGGGEKKKKRKEFTESTPRSITARLHRVRVSRRLRGEGEGRRVGVLWKIRGQQSAPLKW